MPEFPCATHLGIKFGPPELIDLPDLVAACTDRECFYAIAAIVPTGA